MHEKTLPKFTETHIALGLKTATVLIATIALFFQDFTIIFNDAIQSEPASHLLAIPFLFAYLIYRKRNMIRAVIPIENRNTPKETRHLPIIAGILLLAIAVLLYWHGSRTFTPLEYHMLALPIFVAGLALTMFNPQTLRQLAFPIVFLIFLMPPPSEILYALGATLSVISSEASNAIVNIFSIPSTITSENGNPTIIITRPDATPLHFTVDIACSGIYSLIGFLIFAVFIAYIIRDKPWKKLALLIIGLPLIYLLNILRITTILLLGYHYGAELALQVFHLLGGWILIFLATLLLLIISEKIFKTQIFSKPTETCSPHNPPTEPNMGFCLTCGKILKPKPIKLFKKDIAKLTTIIVAIIVLLSIQAPVFALTQGPPIVIVNTPHGQEVSTEILPQVSGYNLSFYYRDTDFEQKAKQDMSLVYLYIPDDASRKTIWVAVEIASTRSSLHRWETCLITWPITHGYQPKVTQIELKDIKLIENPPIISRYFVFQYTKTNVTQAVLYWYETATFATNSTSQQKQVKITLIIYLQNPNELTQAENQLETLATEIANYWQPIKTWSQITMLLSQNSINLATTAGALLTAMAVYYFIEMRKQRKTNTNAYQKLSASNKQIIDAIHETEKTTTPTLHNITITYQNTTQQYFDAEQLFQKLTEIENIGIIKNTLTNKQDEPIQTWKTHINTLRDRPQK